MLTSHPNLLFTRCWYTGKSKCLVRIPNQKWIAVLLQGPQARRDSGSRGVGFDDFHISIALAGDPPWAMLAGWSTLMKNVEPYQMPNWPSRHSAGSAIFIWIYICALFERQHLRICICLIFCYANSLVPTMILLSLMRYSYPVVAWRRSNTKQWAGKQRILGNISILVCVCDDTCSNNTTWKISYLCGKVFML